MADETPEFADIPPFESSVEKMFPHEFLFLVINGYDRSLMLKDPKSKMKIDIRKVKLESHDSIVNPDGINIGSIYALDVEGMAIPQNPKLLMGRRFAKEEVYFATNKYNQAHFMEKEILTQIKRQQHEAA